MEMGMESGRGQQQRGEEPRFPTRGVGRKPRQQSRTPGWLCRSMFPVHRSLFSIRFVESLRTQPSDGRRDGERTERGCVWIDQPQQPRPRARLSMTRRPPWRGTRCGWCYAHSRAPGAGTRCAPPERNRIRFLVGDGSANTFLPYDPCRTDCVPRIAGGTNPGSTSGWNSSKKLDARRSKRVETIEQVMQPMAVSRTGS